MPPSRWSWTVHVALACSVSFASWWSLRTWRAVIAPSKERVNLFYQDTLHRQCGLALLQGRRTQMEDRAVYHLYLADVHGLPLSYYAIFDGHEGAGAADFAASNLHILLATHLEQLASESDAHLLVEGALREALENTNARYLQTAERDGLADGTTAVIALILGSELLVAHLGDSRAILCSSSGAALQPASLPVLSWLFTRGDADSASDPSHSLAAEVITEDHAPGRADERARIVAHGGKVLQTSRGKWRLNGELSISRALGDLPYRQHGLSAEPEFSRWISLGPPSQSSSQPHWLILATDGLFEGLSAEDVCDITHNIAAGKPFVKTAPATGAIAMPAIGEPRPQQQAVEPDPRLALATISQIAEPGSVELARKAHEAKTATDAQCIADTLAEEAYNRRSMDNIAVVVLDLRSAEDTQHSERLNASAAQERNAAQDAPWPTTSMHNLITFPGASHAYELQEQMTPLPQPGHLHTADAEFQLLPRPTAADLVEANPGNGWGFLSPLLAMCIPSWLEQNLDLPPDDAAFLPALPALDPAESELVSKLAAIELEPAEDTAVGDTGQLTEGTDDALRGSWQPGEEVSNPTGSGHWRLGQQFGRGSFGEVWRARRWRQASSTERNSEEEGVGYVLKRMRLEKGEGVRLSGLREVYFGERLNKLAPHLPACPVEEEPSCEPDDGHDHLVRFVESFETQAELWLVFRDEGTSLHNLMYTVAGRGSAAGVQMLEASAWWRELRASPEGEEVIRDLLRQLLVALDMLHSANITHRDVKPENLLVQQRDGDDGRPASLHLRLIDMGSAVDAFSTQRLYGPTGPSSQEQTMEYAPPEALLGRYWSGKPIPRPSWPYDMWSVGVCWLELLLASPHVFTISNRMRSRLDQELRLDQQPQEERVLAYWLRGVMQLCIYPPRPSAHPASSAPESTQRAEPNPHSSAHGSSHKQHDSARRHEGVPMAWSCSEDAVMRAIAERDPTGRGLPSSVALRLLQALLHWNPSSRPTPRQALQHAFFTKAESEYVDCESDPSMPGWC